MSSHQQLVARNVRRFRQERGLSMGELARRAGLAKQTLSTIEQGQGNPTVETLALLGDALDVSLRRLLTEWGTPVYVQRAAGAEWADHAQWRERLLDEVYGSGYVRTLLLRLDRRAHQRPEIDAHTAGTLHHLYVISGRLRTGPLSEPVELGPGDFARYPGDVPHVLAPLTEKVVAFVVSTEPQLRQVAPVR
ncbi:helix-turn-helix domain-containing protein [Nocardioides sp. DS6]|uniref:Helix-turn-helix domain-containing protein n=1 Tax=Nocardioides eburneus TaxID=3231482 RepID=A0ABV3SYR5_9ACTN